MREIRGSYNIEPYCYYCFVLLIFEIDLVGIWLSPLLWYSLHISRSDIVLIFSIYICLKRFGLTFLEEKYPFRDHPISTYAKFSEKLKFLTPPPLIRLIIRYFLTIVSKLPSPPPLLK